MNNVNSNSVFKRRNEDQLVQYGKNGTLIRTDPAMKKNVFGSPIPMTPLEEADSQGDLEITSEKATSKRALVI
jgi:hypothetical protein